jgi:hypothetical protein
MLLSNPVIVDIVSVRGAGADAHHVQETAVRTAAHESGEDDAQ